MSGHHEALRRALEDYDRNCMDMPRYSCYQVIEAARNLLAEHERATKTFTDLCTIPESSERYGVIIHGHYCERDEVRRIHGLLSVEIDKWDVSIAEQQQTCKWERSKTGFCCWQSQCRDNADLGTPYVQRVHGGVDLHLTFPEWTHCPYCGLPIEVVG